MSKGKLISLYSRLHDPVSLLTPFLVTPKLLFHDLWAGNLDWDDSLDVDIAQVWGTWKKELPSVRKIEITRFLLQGLSCIAKVEIHGFADSS